MDETTAIRVENVSKTFKLPHEKQSSIKSAFVNVFQPKRGYELQKALENVSFEVKKGEFFGIVGRNGSGKSTMLKLLAGIYNPTTGAVTVNGSLTPFIELGVGFNAELTGRENVFLNGALLGFNRKEMHAMYKDIVEFAELGKFMDQKLKNYSSGMQVRLAFSIAIRAKSDILLIDEVLAVGDVSFQQKCYDYFDKLKDEKKTIILVTHDMGAVKQFCDRALLIHDGKFKTIGNSEEVSSEYERLNYGGAQADNHAKEDIVGLSILDKKGKSRQKYEYAEPIRFEASWPKGEDVGMVGVEIFRGTEVIFASNTQGQNCNLKKNKATLEIRPKIGEGRYKVKATIFGKNRRTVITSSQLQGFLIFNQPFKGDHDDEWQGIIYVDNVWQ